MIALRQRAVQSVGRVGARRTARYSTAHGKTGDGAHHGSDHGHHAGPKDEPLGIQVYLAVGAVPFSYIVYQLASDSKDGKASAITRLIDSYSYYKEKWVARNTLHTAMIEQAAFDRNLFQSSQGSSHINLKFPEVFNTGSPFNVSAGQSGAGLDKLVAHYEKLNADAEEAKLKALAAREL